RSPPASTPPSRGRSLLPGPPPQRPAQPARRGPPAGPSAGSSPRRGRRPAAARRERACASDLPAASAALDGELCVHVFGFLRRALRLDQRVVDGHRVPYGVSL